MDRLQLQSLLEATVGSTNVYFQPPANLSMQYPCVVYSRDRARTEFAGNKPYVHVKKYQVTVIDQDPDSLIPDEIAKLERCIHVRFFTANNLNHDIFVLYTP